MKNIPHLIKGGNFEDARGGLRFVNDFHMGEVKRMYIIEHDSTAVIRAWQGHKVEQKWFYVLEGSFLVQLIQPDNWQEPSRDLEPETFILSAQNNEVLHIPGGYANGFRALTTPARLMVFSDVKIEEATGDNYRFDKDYWRVWE